MYTRPLKKLNKKNGAINVFILISVKWNLSSHILYFIYMQRLAIQFIEMHFTRTHISFFLYIDQHPGNNCILFIELFTNSRHVSAIKKNNYSIFIPIVAIWPLGKLAEIFFLLKTTQIWVITIVVELDQSPVTFQKGWGRGLLQFVWY